MEKFICEYVAGRVNGHSFWGIPAKEIPDEYYLDSYGSRVKQPWHPANNEWLYWDLSSLSWKNGKNAIIENRDVGMFTYNKNDSRWIYSAVQSQYIEQVSRR